MNASKNISYRSFSSRKNTKSTVLQDKTEENKKNSLINEDAQRTKSKVPILSKRNKQKAILEKQLKLVKNKEVRAVPGKTYLPINTFDLLFLGGYYTGLINDMHKDYINFKEKGTFLQMEYLNSLVQQTKPTSQLIDRFNEERKLEKFKAPMTLNASSIHCTLPSNYDDLENLSPLSFLIKYTKPLFNRQQVVLKLIRKISRDLSIDIDDTKEIIFEYFNHYKTHEDIDELFHFLNINSMNTFDLKEIVIICCYAERYFLHKLSKFERISFERPLQEIIDFEFLKRKLDRLKLNDDLQRLIKSLDKPDNEHFFNV
jgi:hypothetical protein